MGAVFCDLINGFPLFPEVRSRFQIAFLKVHYEPPVVRDDIPVSFITAARGLIAIQPEHRRPRMAPQLLQIIEGLDISEKAQSIEENLARRIHKFDIYRGVHKEFLFSDERAAAKVQLIRDEILSLFKKVQMAVQERFRTEEEKHEDDLTLAKAADVKRDKFGLWASFDICAQEGSAVFFPISMCARVWFNSASDVRVWVGGFYDSSYYQRRTMQKPGSYDSLWPEIKDAWDYLRKSTFDDDDEIYHGIYDRRAIEECLKEGVMKLVDIFLGINEIEILARRQYRRLHLFRVAKITKHGKILERETRWAFRSEPECLLLGCNEKRDTGEALCTQHMAELLPPEKESGVLPH